MSTRQLQHLLKLLCIKDSVKGVFSLKFGGLCHVDAHIGLIPTEGGPDFPSTFAEGDGRPPMCTQPEMGLAKRIADHLNRERCSVGGKAGCPERTVHRHKMIPQDGDQAVPGFFSIRLIFLGGFGVTWQGCIEDRPTSMNGIHRMDGCSCAILCHIHFHLSVPAAQPETQCMRIFWTCMMA